MHTLSQISLQELASIERTYGVRLALTKDVRTKLDTLQQQPQQLRLEPRS